MPQPPARLPYLYPGWFGLPMGLAGLALAWHRALPLLGPGRLADDVALVIAGLAGLAFAMLLVATALRGLRHAPAWAEDRRHPVRHTFVATLPASCVALGTALVALFGPIWPAHLLWCAGAAAQLVVTLWVLARWWPAASGAPGAAPWPWASVTPALFIPVVGNVLVPLGGVPLGHTEWALAQFGVGLMFWPLAMGLLLARLALHGMWPERLLPANLILVAPPSLVGLSLLQLGAPLALAWALWGMAIFSLAWVALLARRIAALPFGLAHWGMSFPLAALAALTLRLAVASGPVAAPVSDMPGASPSPGAPMAMLGLAMLLAVTLLIAALLWATLRGLRSGTLLVPEPQPQAQSQSQAQSQP